MATCLPSLRSENGQVRVMQSSLFKASTLARTRKIGVVRSIGHMRTNKSQTHSLGQSKNASTYVLALIASVAILLLRLHGSTSAGWLWAEYSLLIAISTIAQIVTSRHRTIRDAGQLAWWLGSLVICPPCMPTVLRPHAFGDRGEATELIWLSMLQYAAIWQAAVATTAKQEWTSFLMSCFLMLFGVSTSDRVGMLWIVVPFGLLAAWWLMARHWQSIERGFVAVESVPLVRLRVALVSLLCLMTAGVAGLGMMSNPSMTMLDGFMPTSGGKQDSDPSARHGVGDGDMLVAAQEEAHTFGPVDSNLFLESRTQSMYDVASEIYGEPKAILREVTRAISIESQVQETEKEGTESKKSGREFSAIRQSVDRSNPVKPESTESRAMLYLIGQTPQHLRLESFDRFDGVDWTHSEKPDLLTKLTPPSLRSIHGKPWMDLHPFQKEIAHPVRERLTIKLINIKSSRIATPSLISNVHIDRIDQPDFFDWTTDGQLRMPHRDAIPQLTVIHLLYQIPCLHFLRDASSSLRFIAHTKRDDRAMETYLKVSGNRSEIEKQAYLLVGDRLSKDATQWQRMETMISQVRKDFVVDPIALPPENCSDVVAHTLAARRGPDYLLATTACMLIRSLDIPARLATGFYASPAHYDLRSGQTEVFPEDLHTWVEVFANGAWLPIEPSGNYGIPREYRSWRQFAIESWWYTRDFAFANPIGIAVTSLVLLSIVMVRRRLMDAFISSVFLLLQLVWSRACVRSSLVLLRLRMWVWGVNRPRHATVRDWLDAQLSCDLRILPDDRRLYVATVQKLAYAPVNAASKSIETSNREVRSVAWTIGQRGLLDLFRLDITGRQWKSNRPLETERA